MGAAKRTERRVPVRLQGHLPGWSFLQQAFTECPLCPARCPVLQSLRLAGEEDL